MRYYLLILTVILITSCSLFDREQFLRDEDGVIISIKPLWKKEITDQRSLALGMNTSIAKDGYALIVTHKEGKDYLTWLEAQTGATKWEWTDGRSNYNIRKYCYVMETDKITISSIRSSIAQLDINSGTELFHFKWSDGVGEGSFEKVDKIGSYYYAIRSFEKRADGKLTSTVHRINKESKQLDFYLEPQYPLYDEEYFANGLVGDLRNLKTYQDSGNDYLVMVYKDFAEEMGNSNNLALYNITENKWVYEGIDFTGPNSNNAGNSMDIYQDKVYVTFENQIYCFDIISGELIWKQNFEGFFGSSGFTIGDSMIVANCEEAFTYGVNLDTGQIMWKVTSGGSTSPIAIMNGVAYFSGGSDGRLNAIDITTGQYIWKLKQPGPDFWQRHVTVVPGDGNRPDLIVASTYKEYMAFPAAR